MRGGGGISSTTARPSAASVRCGSCHASTPAAEQVAQIEQPRHLGVGRAGEQAGRRVRLQPAPAWSQHGDAVGQRGLRLVEIVGDKQDGDGPAPAAARQFRLQLAAGGAIDGGERLIQQQHRRIARQRPAPPPRAAAGRRRARRAGDLSRPGQMHHAANSSRTRATRRLSRGRWPMAAGAHSPPPSDAGTGRSPGTPGRRGGGAAGVSARAAASNHTSPPTAIRPAVARCSPALQRGAVDLPAPEEPEPGSKQALPGAIMSKATWSGIGRFGHEAAGRAPHPSRRVRPTRRERVLVMPSASTDTASSTADMITGAAVVEGSTRS